MKKTIICHVVILSIMQVKIGDFVQYSFHNCIAYQKIEIIRKICNCVPFYFPLKYTGFSQVCNFKDMDCLENAMKPIEDMELREKTTTGLFKCLPACEHYDYPLEVALGKLASNLPLNGLEFFNNVNMANSSVVNVFFNDLTSTRYRRDSYLNWQNILAAFGGLLSLMLGFTLVSGCDFILFITFRVIYGYVTRVFGRSVQKKEANKTSIVYVEEKRKKPLKSINEFDKWDNNKSFSRVKY